MFLYSLLKYSEIFWYCEKDTIFRARDFNIEVLTHYIWPYKGPVGPYIVG